MRINLYLILVFLFVSCSQSKSKESTSVNSTNTQDSLQANYAADTTKIRIEPTVTENFPDSLKVKFPSTKNYDVVESSEKEFLAAIKNSTPDFIADTLKYPKRNGQIELPIADKKVKQVIFRDTLENETDNDEYRDYKYLGHYPQLNFYLVEGRFYEYYQCYLVDKDNGNKIEIGGKAKVSPTKKYLVNINEIGGYGDEPIGYQIWKLDNSKKTIKKFIEFDQSEWYPIDFAWNNDNSLLLKIIKMNAPDFNDGGNYKNSKYCVYKKLTIK